MYPAKDIVSNAVNSRDHTTLVAAVKAAGLVETLQGKGPFTVFAPIDGAFAALPRGHRRDAAQAGEQAEAVVRARPTTSSRVASPPGTSSPRSGRGTAARYFTTVNGQTLTAMLNGPMNVALRDASGGVSSISTYDVLQSNGVIHVTDHVLLPKM